MSVVRERRGDRNGCFRGRQVIVRQRRHVAACILDVQAVQERCRTGHRQVVGQRDRAAQCRQPFDRDPSIPENVDIAAVDSQVLGELDRVCTAEAAAGDRNVAVINSVRTAEIVERQRAAGNLDRVRALDGLQAGVARIGIVDNSAAAVQDGGVAVDRLYQIRRPVLAVEPECARASSKVLSIRTQRHLGVEQKRRAAEGELREGDTVYRDRAAIRPAGVGRQYVRRVADHGQRARVGVVENIVAFDGNRVGACGEVDHLEILRRASRADIYVVAPRVDQQRVVAATAVEGVAVPVAG